MRAGRLLVQVAGPEDALKALILYKDALVFYEAGLIDPIIISREGFPCEARVLQWGDVDSDSIAKALDCAIPQSTEPKPYLFQTKLTGSEVVARLLINQIVSKFMDVRPLARKASV